MANQRPLMTGLFPDRESAELGFNTLSERGYSKDDINVVMSDATKKRHFVPAGTETELGNKAAEGAGVGGAIGGTVGAIAAAIVDEIKARLVPVLDLNEDGCDPGGKGRNRLLLIKHRTEDSQ